MFYVFKKIPWAATRRKMNMVPWHVTASSPAQTLCASSGPQFLSEVMCSHVCIDEGECRA